MARFKVNLILLTLLVVDWPPLLMAQSSMSAQVDSSQIRAGRLAIATTAAAATLIGIHLYQQRAWWQGPRAPFRFENDWRYALNIDKFGHAYGAYVESKLFARIVSWIGLNDPASTFYGSAFGLAFQFYVEVEDGYHQEYGFSPGDAFADILGAAIPLVQQAVPRMENFNLKFSYFPSRTYLDDLRRGRSRTFLDDYQGQTFWVGVDPHFLLSESLRSIVPSWLGVSFGAAVRNLDGLGGGEKSFYLTVDFNLSKITTDSDFLRALFTSLDYLHLPAPGIAIKGNRFEVGVFY